MAEKMVLASVAVVFEKIGKKTKWFVVKEEEDGEWELPKTTARRGESSVRAGIRMMGEQGGMDAKVLEEVGRSGGAAKLNGNLVAQRYLYYLMRKREGGEVIGFHEYKWLHYGKAVRKLQQKRDAQMLREANKLQKKLERERKKNMNN